MGLIICFIGLSTVALSKPQSQDQNRAENSLEADNQKIPEAGNHWLGFACRQITPSARAWSGLGSGRGLMIYSIAENGPAAKSGIKLYDILLSIDGVAVSDKVAVADVYKGSPKKQVLTLLRKDEEIRLTITPQNRPPEKVVDPVPAPEKAGVRNNFLDTINLVVNELGDQRLGQLPSGYNGGVEVISAGSRAERFGLRKGDILIAVDGWKIENLDNLQYVLDQQARFDKFYLVRPNVSGKEVLVGSIDEGLFPGMSMLEAEVAKLKRQWQGGFDEITQVKMELASLLVDATESNLVDLEVFESFSEKRTREELERAKNSKHRAQEQIRALRTRIRQMERENRSIKVRLDVARHRQAEWKALNELEK